MFLPNTPTSLTVPSSVYDDIPECEHEEAKFEEEHEVDYMPPAPMLGRRNTRSVDCASDISSRSQDVNENPQEAALPPSPNKGESAPHATTRSSPPVAPAEESAEGESGRCDDGDRGGMRKGKGRRIEVNRLVRCCLAFADSLNYACWRGGETRSLTASMSQSEMSIQAAEPLRSASFGNLQRVMGDSLKGRTLRSDSGVVEGQRPAVSIDVTPESVVNLTHLAQVRRGSFSCLLLAK